jgi:hypothetical protein
MIKAPIAANDYLRVKSLQEMEILDTLEEEDFNNIVQLAASICKTPIALISLLDESREWFKAKTGILSKQRDRDTSFCGHAIAQDNYFFQVEDALKDQRFIDNPMVTTAPKIRFYAGVQLINRKGYKVGMLCVSDTKPNVLTDEQVFALKVLANAVTKLMDLRFIHKQSDEKSKKIQSLSGTQEMLMSMMAHDAKLYENRR